MKLTLKLLHVLWLLLIFNSDSLASVSTFPNSSVDTYTTIDSQSRSGDLTTPVEQRDKKEEKIVPLYSFAIAFYKPNYVLPYYITASPDSLAYQGNTPNGHKLKSSEFKYQISFKTPLWRNMFGKKPSLNFAYTQLSYWQLYAPRAFFRETDYEPELFVAGEINYALGRIARLDFLNIGAVHQSNGFGGALERSWNRLYLEAIFSTEHAMVSIRPWYVIKDSSLKNYNPDIAQYLGYGRLLMAYKIKGHVLSLSVHNLIEGHARRATGELTWSFPFLVPSLKGFFQLFSGYGQSLIEYNHRTNSAGIGLALNDWI